jgi:hypothetical protein
MKRNFLRRSVLSALLAWSITGVQGQFNIVPLAVSPIYLKAQLWNLTISYTGSAPVQGRIQLDMKDIQTHQSVLSAVSTSFRVASGATMVQMQSMEPIVYSYNSPVVIDRSANGMLPLGQYQVCYQLLLTYGENQNAVAEDCEEIAVEPLSPPLLTMPENDSVLSVLTPNFMWVPPAPVTMFAELTYDVLISEVYEGQSITDAVQKNLPLQQAQGLSQPFLSFPLTGPQLEDGKTYAWQVVARDQRQYAAKSEVWSFRTPANKAATSNNNSMYMLMDGRPSGVGTSDSSMLHIKYISSVTAYSSPVQVRDQSGNVLLTTQCTIRQGDNYLDIPLNGRFQRQHNYTVVFQDRTGKQTSLLFTIK